MKNIKKVFVFILCICCFTVFTIITITAQKNEKVEQSNFNENPLPEIANLDQYAIKIYGVKSSGVVVCFENESKFFEWNWQNSIGELPVIAFEDFNNDGKKELCYIVNLYQGTGTSSQELHLLEIEKINNDTLWTDYTFSENTTREQLLKKVHFSQNNHIISIRINDDIKDITIPFQNQIDNITLLYPAFEINNNQIKVSFEIAVFYDDKVIPDTLEYQVAANIIFQNDTYQLDNIHFE